MLRVLQSLILLLLFCIQVSGHQLPDHEIERRVQVSVKPDRVLIEYSIAMNESTLKRELVKHGIDPAATRPEFWKQYQVIALQSLHKKLRLTMDGKVIPIEPIQAHYSGWSHRHLTCLLRADFAFTKPLTKIALTDGNFPDAQGNFRIAMKGRSGVKIEKATVPLLVSRAKPVVLPTLTKSQKEIATSARGEVVPDQF